MNIERIINRALVLIFLMIASNTFFAMEQPPVKKIASLKEITARAVLNNHCFIHEIPCPNELKEYLRAISLMKWTHNDPQGALSMAILQGHNDAITHLVDLGALLELKRRPISFENNSLPFLVTPLMDATLLGYYQAVVALLKAGAEINCRDGMDQRTPLMVASNKGRLDMVQILLEWNAQVDIQDRDGHTALIFAAYEGHYEIVKALLAKGADVHKRNMAGETALLFASRKKDNRIIDLLTFVQSIQKPSH